jgi:Tfp pilus assembly protein PilF
MTEDTAMAEGGVKAPNTSEDYTKSGWSHLAAHEYDQAESDFRMALSLNSNQVDAMYGLAMTLKGTGQKSEAIEAFAGVDTLLNDDDPEDKTRAEMLRKLTRAQRDLISIEQDPG